MKRLLGLLGWLGVVLVLAAVVIRLTKPELQPWSQGFALAGLVTTALYALSQWRDIGRSFQGRNVKYGSVAVGSVLLFLAILVAINWIGAREHKRWDFTLNKQFTMSDQTKKILSGLTKPVSVHVFYDRQSGSASEFKDKFDEYHVPVGPDHQRSTWTRSTTRCSRRSTASRRCRRSCSSPKAGPRRRTRPTSRAITNSLKKLLEGTTKKIYFVQGHGEHSTDDTSGKPGYGGLAASLKNDNFEVAKVTLAQEGKVPDDAAVVVVGGPKIDYLAPEVDLLRGYLRRGGKVLLLIDPPEKADAPPFTNLIAFAREFDIEVGNNVVVDASGLGQLFGANEAVPIAMPSNPPHAITRDFGQMTAFPLTRSVTPIEGGVNGKTAQKLLETSPRSWAETDLKGLFATGKASPDPAQGDKTGPISIAAAVSFPRGRDVRRDRFESGGPPRRRRRQRLHLERRDQLRRQPRPRAEHGQLARAAGRPDRDPPERGGRPAHHAHAGPEQLHVLDRDLHHSRTVLRQRLQGVVEETVSR